MATSMPEVRQYPNTSRIQGCAGHCALAGHASERRRMLLFAMNPVQDDARLFGGGAGHVYLL